MEFSLFSYDCSFVYQVDDKTIIVNFIKTYNEFIFPLNELQKAFPIIIEDRISNYIEGIETISDYKINYYNYKTKLFNFEKTDYENRKIVALTSYGLYRLLTELEQIDKNCDTFRARIIKHMQFIQISEVNSLHELLNKYGVDRREFEGELKKACSG